MMSGARARAQSRPASSSISRGSGGGRRMRQTRRSNKRAGKSKASVCASWQKASVAGPQVAGSSRVAMARGSDVDQLLRPL